MPGFALVSITIEAAASGAFKIEITIRLFSNENNSRFSRSVSVA
jgi:hypothetical protein